MSKKIPELNLVPGNVLASNLFFEVARQISANAFNGESERIAADTLIALLTNAGAAININLISTLNPTNAAWDSARTYTPYDYLDVAYQGKHYVYSPAKQPSAGHLPTEAAYWILISSDGAVGPTGPQGPAGQSITGPAGPAGTPGSAGANGTSAVAIIAGTPPAIPAVSSSATYTVNSTAGLISQQYYGIGSIAGTLKITAIPSSTTVILQNIDATAGATVSVGAVLAPVGKTGAAGSGGGVSGIQYLYNTTAGTGVISAADPSTATTLTINSTDATTPAGKNTATVLSRLKVGAIFEVKKDASNYVRYVVSADYASGSVGVTVDAFAGTIANNNTVYLSIVSDALGTGTGSGSGLSAGILNIIGDGSDTLTLQKATDPSGFSWPPLILDVYRSASNNFPPASNLLASNITLPYNDAPPASGTYYYRVTVKDQLNMIAATPIVFATAASATFDTSASAVFTAIEATGATLTGPQKTAANNMIVAFKNPSNGSIWDKLAYFHGFLGGTAASHAINWKTPGTYDITWVGTGLVHNATGVKGDGTASAGYVPYNLQQSLRASVGFGAYLIQDATGTTQYILGGNLQGGNGGFVSIRGNGALSVAAFGYTTSFSPLSLGSLLVTQSSTTKVYKGASVTSNATNNAGSYGGTTNYLGVLGNWDSVSSFSDYCNAKIGSVVLFSSEPTSSEAIAFANALTTYQNALGR